MDPSPPRVGAREAGVQRGPGRGGGPGPVQEGGAQDPDSAPGVDHSSSRGV